MAVYNRERFLDQLAGRLGRPRKTTADRPAYSVQPQERVFQGADQDQLLGKLKEQCEIIHTTLVETTVDELGDTLRRVWEEGHIQNIVSAGGPRLEAYGLLDVYETMRQEGYNVHIWDEQGGRDDVAEAEKAGAGVVFSDVTLAESGTVTLFNDRWNGRSISLLPEIFVAIIPKSTLVPRMTQAAQIIHEQEKKGVPVSSCVSFITGPSNSADIEMNLIVGVHGPVKATYIVVDDKEG